MTELLSLDFLKVFIPLLGAIGAWFVNERQKRIWEEYQRKEKQYQMLIESLEGF